MPDIIVVLASSRYDRDRTETGRALQVRIAAVLEHCPSADLTALADLIRAKDKPGIRQWLAAHGLPGRAAKSLVLGCPD